MIKFFLHAVIVLISAVFSLTAYSAVTEQDFFEKRSALIIKHGHHDTTFSALLNEKKAQKTFSSEYWRWRIDQYLYGQYIEFQPIYNAYIKGKKFNEIYDLPAEKLGPKWQEPKNLPELPNGYFTGNLPGNAYTGWHRLIGDTLYITYQGHLTDPYVTSYNLTTKKWSGPFKAGHSTLSKGDRKIDSHGRPIIEIDDQGYIHIVFGGHGGEREDGLNPLSIDTPHAGGRMKHVVSNKPYDLSAFTEKNDITPFASYTKSYKMANGDIYFFTRAGTHKSPWLYYKMKSGSQTFEPPVIISWPTPDKNNPILVDTHYINPLKVSDTDIVITSLWHQCNFNETHDKTHYNRLNAYYMRLDTTDDTLYNVKNDKLILPLTFESKNTYTLAYDSQKAGETSFGTKPLVLKSGLPALAYEARGQGYREWRMAKYEKGSWSHGHPMPGTTTRTILDQTGQPLKNIISLEILEPQSGVLMAAVTYRNGTDESAFGIAKAIRYSEDKQVWKIEKRYLNVSQARLRIEPVKNNNGKAIAVIVNVKKGASQRLYLWHENKIRENKTVQ